MPLDADGYRVLETNARIVDDKVRVMIKAFHNRPRYDLEVIVSNSEEEDDELFADDEGDKVTFRTKLTKLRKKKKLIRYTNKKNMIFEDEPVLKMEASSSFDIVRFKHYVRDGDDSFESSSSDGDDSDEVCDKKELKSDLSNDYWQIQKLVKYLKAGNQTATVISLCALLDFNFETDSCQVALRDVGGIEILINLLETEHIKCKIGALRILRLVSRSFHIRKHIVDFGGIQSLIKVLHGPNRQIKWLAAETIANVTTYRSARRIVRQFGGFKRLVKLLDIAGTGSTNSEHRRQDIEVARCASLALESCSYGTKNKNCILEAGAVPYLGRLMSLRSDSILIPVMGTLQACATEPLFREAIRNQGLIDDFVAHLRSNKHVLQIHSASGIFKCAEDSVTRDLVRKYKGIEPIVHLLRKESEPDLLIAVTGAVWKCAISLQNVVQFHRLNTIDLLVNLLTDQPEPVLVNVVGAIAELSHDPASRQCIRQSGGIPFLIHLLTDIHVGTNRALLINVAKAIGQCAQDTETMKLIHKSDGVRLLWSLLKNTNPSVIRSAAWAICSCIEHSKENRHENMTKSELNYNQNPDISHISFVKEKIIIRDKNYDSDGELNSYHSNDDDTEDSDEYDAGETVRSFVGGLELIVSLLKHEDIGVLTSILAAITNISKDEENLAVISDHGVVPLLSRLTVKLQLGWTEGDSRKEDDLRLYLSETIARCCKWSDNRIVFGQNGAVAPLVGYLSSDDINVKRSTVRALYELSAEPDNCIVMHECSAVKILVKMVQSTDIQIQEHSAGIIGNIRAIAIANEKFKTQ